MILVTLFQSLRFLWFRILRRELTWYLITAVLLASLIVFITDLRSDLQTLQLDLESAKLLISDRIEKP